MKKWPQFRDIFSFRPTTDPQHSSLGLEGGENQDASKTTAVSDSQLRWQKIKFDNTVRLWIAVPTYLACYALWTQKSINSIVPMTIVFSAYGLVQFLTNWIFMGTRFGRKFDYIFSTLDITAMSFSIYFTGGTSSPLYFLYFIPLVVHAFHRDWELVIYSGFGGVVFYAVAICKSLTDTTPASLMNLGARLFFMLLTVSVACLAITMLRNKDAADMRKLLRLKNLALISERLNHLVSLADLGPVATDLIALINQGLGTEIRPWTRFFFVQKNAAIMKAVADPEDERPDLKQELSTFTCPAMQNNQRFLLEDSQSGEECPVENFSFGSHACIPVSGSENEPFGVLFVGSPLSHAFQEGELQFIGFVGRSLGLSIQRLNRMEELRRSVEMNSCVMAATIASARSLDATFSAVVDGLVTILKVERASLMLWESSHNHLKTVQVKGAWPEEERNLTLQAGKGVPGRALEQGECIWADTDSEQFFGEGTMPSIKSILSLPLKTLKGERLGVINAASCEVGGGFSGIELEIAATFATRAALAIENALMHDVERRQFKKAA